MALSNQLWTQLKKSPTVILLFETLNRFYFLSFWKLENNNNNQHNNNKQTPPQQPHAHTLQEKQ